MGLLWAGLMCLMEQVNSISTFLLWSRLFKGWKLSEADSKPSQVVLMTSKLKLVLVILLSLQTRIILMKPSSFLRSPSYVDFFGGRDVFNKHEEDSLQKKANSIQLEGLPILINFEGWVKSFIIKSILRTNSLFWFQQSSSWSKKSCVV